MELTLREAATILDITPRAARARVRRGTLRGYKRGGRWLIPRAALDDDPGQRRRLRAVSDETRATVEGALPDREARSVSDLKPFREARRLVIALEPHHSASEPTSMARAALIDGLGRLAEGHHQFHRDDKLAGYGAARALFCRALACLLLTDSQPALAAARTIEREVLPPLAGLIRWAERLT